MRPPLASETVEQLRLRVLASVSDAFASVATDYSTLLQLIARSTADYVGDGCLVTMIEGEDLVNATNAHRDPALEADYAAFSANLRLPLATSTAVAATVARSGMVQFARSVDPQVVVDASDEAIKPIARRLNVHAYGVVPIRARGQILGTLSVLRSGHGRSYTNDDLVLLQDLADRAGLAIENARQYLELEHRVRVRTAELEAINHELEAFSYSVAHDLRAPLRSIDRFTRAVLEDHPLPPDGRNSLERVLGAAAHMATLIDDLLDLSRVTSAELNRRRVDVSALAETVLGRMRERDPARVVDVAIAPAMIADADPRLLDVVLTNLLGNAWKFTRNRERARISMSWEPATNVFAIVDNGAGFDAARATGLFGVFQRFHLPNEFEGTGIGLATVQRIIHRHGGKVWAEAEVDRGATFRFTLAPP